MFNGWPKVAISRRSFFGAAGILITEPQSSVLQASCSLRRGGFVLVGQAGESRKSGPGAWKAQGPDFYVFPWRICTFCACALEQVSASNSTNIIASRSLSIGHECQSRERGGPNQAGVPGGIRVLETAQRDWEQGRQAPFLPFSGLSIQTVKPTGCMAIWGLNAMPVSIGWMACHAPRCNGCGVYVPRAFTFGTDPVVQ